MAIINPGDERPTLEQSGDERFVSYGIYKCSEGQYLLLKFFSTRKSEAVLQDPDFAYFSTNVVLLHNIVSEQGFVPFSPSPEDDPRLVMSYI